MNINNLRSKIDKQVYGQFNDQINYQIWNKINKHIYNLENISIQ